MNAKQFVTSIFILTGIITIYGLFLDIMAPDGALYASIAKTMYLNNDFINLYFLGEDWLDKPHLPFWLTAISFHLFGVNSFAYKFPAVLTFILGVYITYKFVKETYNKETAIIAVIILITSLHNILSNFDVRAEPFLTTFIIGAIYYFHSYLKSNTFYNLLLGCLFTALALMTKGTFTLLPIAAALGGELIIKRNWKQLYAPIWLVALALILLFILPELYALYIQFDTHPEKTVFGKNNVSGIRFFLWDSQFGRFFNTGPIVNNQGNVFFFVHTILWAFAPWGILFYIALFLKLKRNFRRVHKNEEFYSLFATLSVILLFSMSKFQLSHYTNIVFPFMAMITADFIYQLKTTYIKFQKAYTFAQYAMAGIAISLIPVVYYIMVDNLNIIFLILTLCCLFIIYQAFQAKNIIPIYKTLIICTVSFLSFYSFLITSFYPTLLKYQGDVYAANYINSTTKNLYLLRNDTPHFCFEFYNKTPITRVNTEELKKLHNQTLYLSEHLLNQLKDQQISYTIIKEFQNFRITKLTFNFVNKTTRNKVVNKTYLIAIN